MPVSPAPLLTVAMPIYNAGRYLRSSVSSIINQTFKDWELIIIDDGSTDHAISELEDLRDSRILIFKDSENRGLAARLNEIILMARGQYFARMDHDDIAYPERFARQIQALNANTALDLVAVRSIMIDEEDGAVGFHPFSSSHEDITSRPWRSFYFPHPTWMGRTAWFRQNLYKTPAPYGSEDQELLLRTYSFSNFMALSEVLFAYRIRTRIDIPRILRARRAVLQFQALHFMRSKQYLFLLKSTTAFFLRVSFDLFKWLKFRFGFRNRPKNLDSDAQEMWNKLRKQLEEKHLHRPSATCPDQLDPSIQRVR